MIENMNGISSVATLPLPIQREVIGNAGRVRAYIQAYELEAAVNKTVSLAQSELPSGSETLFVISNDLPRGSFQSVDCIGSQRLTECGHILQAVVLRISILPPHVFICHKLIA